MVYMHTASKTTHLPVEWIPDPIARLLFSNDKDAHTAINNICWT